MTLRQPTLGLAGLLLVIPMSIVLAFGAGGAEPSLRALGPLVTFAFPALAMIAFWWNDWPGSLLRPGWSGLTDTLLIAVAALLFSVFGHVVTGSGFESSMRLAAGALVAMLQLTLVCDRWPLRGLPQLAGGLAALAMAWALAVIAYLADVPGTLLLLIAVWQTWFFVAWQGWPLAGRLLLSNVVILGGAVLTYVVVDHLRPGDVAAAAASLIAAGLVFGVLFEGWLRSRAWMLVGVVALAAALDATLGLYAGGLAWTVASAQDWVVHAELNAIGASVIAHVAIGRRWPFQEQPAHI